MLSAIAHRFRSSWDQTSGMKAPRSLLKKTLYSILVSLPTLDPRICIVHTGSLALISSWHMDFNLGLIWQPCSWLWPDPWLAAGPGSLAWAPLDCAFVSSVPGFCLEILSWSHPHLPPLLGLALGRNFMTPRFFLSTLGLITSHLPPHCFSRGSHRLVIVIWGISSQSIFYLRPLSLEVCVLGSVYKSLLYIIWNLLHCQRKCSLTLDPQYPELQLLPYFPVMPHCFPELGSLPETVRLIDSCSCSLSVSLFVGCLLITVSLAPQTVAQNREGAWWVHVKSVVRWMSGHCDNEGTKSAWEVKITYVRNLKSPWRSPCRIWVDHLRSPLTSNSSFTVEHAAFLQQDTRDRARPKFQSHVSDSCCVRNTHLSNSGLASSTMRCSHR